jgi:putative membrane protein insertion efficiency factor
MIIQSLLLFLIKLYRYCLSPLLPTHSCRFLPTCSCYAAEAIALHGTLKGSYLSLRRLFRCHPWGDSGFDPVPPSHSHSTFAKAHHERNA